MRGPNKVVETLQATGFEKNYKKEEIEVPCKIPDEFDGGPWSFFSVQL